MGTHAHMHAVKGSMSINTKQASPADLHVAIILKQREEAQLRWLCNAFAQLPCHFLLTIEAVGGGMAGEHQVDQVLTAVAMLCYEAGLWLIHILPSLPAHIVKHISHVQLGGDASHYAAVSY